MTTVRYHLTKAGPRLLDVLVDSPQIDCTVTGPGMLIEAFKLLTDRDALSGCDARFHHSVADDLQGDHPLPNMDSGTSRYDTFAQPWSTARTAPR